MLNTTGIGLAFLVVVAAALDAEFVNFSSSEVLSSFFQSAAWVVTLEMCLFLGLLASAWIVSSSASESFLLIFGQF